MPILVNNGHIFEGIAVLIPGASLGIALAGPSDSVLPCPPMYCLLISVGPGEGVYNHCQSRGLGLTVISNCIDRVAIEMHNSESEDANSSIERHKFSSHNYDNKLIVLVQEKE